jgi:hypothetical protein
MSNFIDRKSICCYVISNSDVRRPLYKPQGTTIINDKHDGMDSVTYKIYIKTATFPRLDTDKHTSPSVGFTSTLSRQHITALDNSIISF